MWMTIEETADYLRVSKDTIYRMAQKAEIPSSKLGKQWRFNRETIDQWLKSKTFGQDSIKMEERQ